MKQTTEPFEELMIPRRELHTPSAVIYRVYRDYKNFELVEAVSALDALAVSKNKNVYKIERHNPLGDNVIHLKQVMKMFSSEGGDMEENFAGSVIQQQDVPVPITIPVAEEAIPEPIEKPAAAPMEDAPLSNDDIDKLLNG